MVVVVVRVSQPRDARDGEAIVEGWARCAFLSSLVLNANTFFFEEKGFLYDFKISFARFESYKFSFAKVCRGLMASAHYGLWQTFRALHFAVLWLLKKRKEQEEYFFYSNFFVYNDSSSASRTRSCFSKLLVKCLKELEPYANIYPITQKTWNQPSRYCSILPKEKNIHGIDPHQYQDF
jgi:hypothetical protein